MGGAGIEKYLMGGDKGTIEPGLHQKR